jgi:3-deoxy-manno-octulosonate cytidylyltransferase (CMP-KDO synthetase)
MLQHVWERASQARYLSDLVIATDDQRIADAAAEFGGRVVMTRADHVSGTDRVAEAASSSNAQFVVNVQGDEPMIDPAAIDAAILALLHGDDDVPMATLAKRIERPEDIADPNVVKVVMDLRGLAIYFSRSPIPYVRTDGDVITYFKHIGLYVYRTEFLLEYSSLRIGPLEQAERLEQLRAIENGYKIVVQETEYDSLGVDTPEDWHRIAELFERTHIPSMVNR